MPKVRFMNGGELKSYLYRSRAKVDLLYQQVRGPKPKRTIKWKIDLKLASVEIGRERPTEISDQEKLDAVLKALEKRKLVGAPEECREYIKGILPMQWGLFNDESFRPATEGPLVYFSGPADGLLLGLGGSSIHVGNPYGIGGTGSCSYTPILYRWLRSGLDSGQRPPRAVIGNPDAEAAQIAEAMALANHFLEGPVQHLEFVAKVLWRGDGYALRPWSKEDRGAVILGTPLYVVQVNTRIVDA